jgi:hypothetical protein
MIERRRGGKPKTGSSLFSVGENEQAGGENGVTLALTLTLSPEERESPLFTPRISTSTTANPAASIRGSRRKVWACFEKTDGETGAFG